MLGSKPASGSRVPYICGVLIVCFLVFVVQDAHYIPGVWLPWMNGLMRIGLSVVISFAGMSLAHKLHGGFPGQSRAVWLALGLAVGLGVLLSLLGLRLGYQERFRAEVDQYRRALDSNSTDGPQYRVSANETTYTIWPWSQDTGILHDPTGKFLTKQREVGGFRSQRATEVADRFYFVRR